MTQDICEAVRFAKAHALAGVELRSAEDLPIDAVPLAKVKGWKKLLDAEGLAVPCVAGSFYKCASSDAEAVAENIEKLARLIDAADALDCGFIRGFAFFRPAEGAQSPAALAPFFIEPARMLRARGKRLLLEADPSVNTSNHAALAALLGALGDGAFGAIYDPGNDLFDPLGEVAYPDGYEAIRPYLSHVHIKDAVRKGGAAECVAPGAGEVGYRDLLKRLVRDGYDGWLSLETHYRKRGVLTEAQMRVPAGGAFSAGGREAMEESCAALQALLGEI